MPAPLIMTISEETAMTPIVFLDTETTSLNPWRRAWDIALIRRDDSGEQGYKWFIRSEDLDLGNADPFSLRIGRFYDRHPDYAAGVEQAALPERDVLQVVEELTRGAHLVGAVPNFDADVLDRRMRANGILPSWHHRLRCVESVACGHLHREVGGLADVAEALGIEVDDIDRHTAIGDARLVMAVWDRVMADAS